MEARLGRFGPRFSRLAACRELDKVFCRMGSTRYLHRGFGRSEKQTMQSAVLFPVSRAAEVLDFWFGECGPDKWFAGGEAFDREVAGRLGPWHKRACGGSCEAWRGTAEGSLALILLWDQVSRHLGRGTALAFAWDETARGLCKGALAAGYDRGLPSAVEKLFFYLPLEHSEDLADQEASVRLISSLGNRDWTDYAVRHRDVVARFGRFPHRNEALARASTAEELAFLEQPGSRF
jgi:uncharacterized protein (DUF924 family)